MFVSDFLGNVVCVALDNNAGNRVNAGAGACEACNKKSHLRVLGGNFIKRNRVNPGARKRTRTSTPCGTRT